MGLSGYVAGGAQDALTEALERRMREQIRQQQEQQQAAQLALQQQQQQAQQENQRRTIDLADLRRRDDNNRQGLELMQQDKAQMDTDAIMGSLSPEQRRMVDLRRVGIEPPKPPTRQAVTVPGANGRPMRRLVSEDELAAGVEEYREPKAALAREKPSYIQVTGPDGTMQMLTAEEIRAKGGVPTTKGNAPDPQKAREVLEKIVDAGTKLKGSPGLGNLTGNRLMNPDYNMGWSDDPRPGSKAATAKAQYDTLKSVMTLENLSLLKGAMSDKDLLFLQAAGSSLNTAMEDPAFVEELDGIISRAQQKLGIDTPAPNAGTSPVDWVYDPKTKTMKRAGQ